MATGTPIKTFTDRDGNKHQVIGTGAGTGLNGHLAEFDENGQIKDGGAKSQFAAAVHSHDMIKKEGTGTYEGDSAAIVTGVDSIDIEIEKSGTLYNAEIDSTNFANLQRALQSPVAPASSGDKLVTNGQVYAAITPIALSAYKAEGGAYFPLAAKTSDTAKLDGFIETVDKGALHPVVFTVDDVESHNIAVAVGYAKWVDGSEQETVDVIIYVGAGIEFKASAQTGGESNTLATNWVLTDNSASFAIGGQS